MLLSKKNNNLTSPIIDEVIAYEKHQAVFEMV